MKIIMFHIGRGELPLYLEDNFRQLRLFNPNATVYFMTEKYFLRDPLFVKYNIEPIRADDYYTNKITHFVAYYQYGALPEPYQFWVITATRLMYIEEFMRRYRLSNVYHFENDVLLYCDLEKLHSTISRLYHNMAITVGGPDKCITGLLYISNRGSLSRMTQFFVDSLHKYGKKNLIKMYQMDMVNEMTLMRAYSKESPDDLQFLPILPFGEWSTNFLEFQSIFDPASWGQLVGGNAQEKQPGLKPLDHYIGTLLRENVDYTVVWKEDTIGRKIPYFKYNGSEVPINNLHIHSKNLHLYMSK